MSAGVVPAIFKWRVTLRCGCTWRFESDPDLSRPLMCGVNDHGLVMIERAERISR